MGENGIYKLALSNQMKNDQPHTNDKRQMINDKFPMPPNPRVTCLDAGAGCRPNGKRQMITDKFLLPTTKGICQRPARA